MGDTAAVMKADRPLLSEYTGHYPSASRIRRTTAAPNPGPKPNRYSKRYQTVATGALRKSAKRVGPAPGAPLCTQ